MRNVGPLARPTLAGKMESAHAQLGTYRLPATNLF